MMTCERCHVLKMCVRQGLTVVNNYSWLLNAFVLDYYTEDHWKKIPASWREVLDSAEPAELGMLLDLENWKESFQRVWPLSLLALRAACAQLSIPRQQFVNDMPEETSFSSLNSTQQDVSACNLHRKVKMEESSLPIHGLLMRHPELSHVFIKHVKPKKQHEVTKMAEITAETAHLAGCQFIVDVGSGLGHLARTLSYGYGMRVCCLEAQDTLAKQARKLDLELQTTLSKHLSTDEMNKLHQPVHISITISPQMSNHEFMEALCKAFHITEQNELKFGIVGLHPCGDLGPMLLQLFANCSNARFINIVGCCYMKITAGNTDSSYFRGYPMSNFVLERPHVLSYEAREIACHAIENYCSRLYSGDIYHLKVHCYRATLERLLVKYWPELRHSGVRSIKHAHRMSFENYCTAALQKLGVELPESELRCRETEDNLSQWKRVVILYSLRLMLAPLVETVLLLDRLLFLQELNISSVLIPAFNPTQSPRNHILVGAKLACL